MGRQADKDSRETKELILKEATEIFELKGFNKTSMRDIQLKTQLSKGTIYYHFRNKEELFLSCIKRESDKSLKNWKTIAAEEKDATGKLYAWAELGIIEMKRPITRSLFEYIDQLSDSEAGNEVVESILLNELESIKVIIKEGMHTGEYKSDLDSYDTSVIIMNLITSFKESSLYGYDSLERQKALGRQAIRMLLEGMTPRLNQDG